MVASVGLRRMTESVDEFRWATSKSTSTDDDADDVDVNTGNEVGDNHDDDTIQYDNTTLSHIMRQQQQQQQQRQQQQIEEQRTSPSSVVPRHVPTVISCCSTNCDHHHQNSNSNSSGSNNSTTVLSIPTLRGVKTSTTNATPTLDSATATTTTTPVVIAKPFFIMDFLEDIDPTSLRLVQQILQQQKEKSHLLSSSSLSQRGEDVSTQINRPTTTCLSFRPSVENQNHYKNENNNDDDEDYWTNDNQFIPLPEYLSCMTTTIVVAAPTTNNNNNTYFLQRSWDIARQFHYRGMQAAQTAGDWHKAVRYWLDALDIYDQIVSHHHNNNDNFNNNHDGDTTTMVGDTYHNIGIAYGKLDQYTDALPYLLKALEIRIDSVTAADDDDDANATNEGSDAITSTTTKSTLATEASSAPPQQLHRDIAASLYAIGHIYQKQNELSMAICYFSKCQFVLDELSYPGRHYDMARTTPRVTRTRTQSRPLPTPFVYWINSWL